MTAEVQRLKTGREEFMTAVVERANTQLEERVTAQVAHDQKVLDEQTAEHQAILDAWAANLDIALAENEALRVRMAELETENARLVEEMAGVGRWCTWQRMEQLGERL